MYFLLGRHYLEKYRYDENGDRTQLMTVEYVNKFENSEIRIDTWIGSVKHYVRQVDVEMIQDKSMIFIIEAQTFNTYTIPSRQLCIVVC